jgi:N-acetylmuramoyl-L-alanine amidase
MSSLTTFSKKRIITSVSVLLLIISITNTYGQKVSPLAGKVIAVDAGHGGTGKTDLYRQGPTGEREEWINLRIAFAMKKLLEERGAKVILTRTEDVFVPIADRAKIATDAKVDLFVSIHHNATADNKVNFPIIYYNGTASENLAGVALGKLLAQTIPKYMYKSKTIVSLVSDNTIFPGAGLGVLRGTYGIPAVLAEASFFTDPIEEDRLRQPQHNEDEALAYVKAFELFFSKPQPQILVKDPAKSPPPFKAAQEAERMNEVARRWKQNYLDGVALMKSKDTVQLRKAYELLTTSARSFPDSPVAAMCHKYRSQILVKLGKPAEAAEEEKRFKEYYVPVGPKGY